MVSAPEGTVTFLFTDIEGSTRRWKSEPDAMRVALAAHDEVLRAAIEARGGWLFKNTGDGVCAECAPGAGGAPVSRAGVARGGWRLGNDPPRVADGSGAAGRVPRWCVARRAGAQPRRGGVDRGSGGRLLGSAPGERLARRSDRVA